MAATAKKGARAGARTTPIGATVKRFGAAAAAGREAAEAVAKAGNEAATRNYEQAVAATREHVEKTMPGSLGAYDELTAFGRGNIDALFASSAAVAKGVEALAQEYAAYAQKSLEANLSAVRSILGAKTLREMVDAQQAFVKASFDELIAESAKLSELTAQVANDACEPFNGRAEQAVETFFKRPAA